MNISDCVKELQAFENTFAAAKQLRDIFEQAKGIEAEKNRLKAEMDAAVIKTEQAKRELAQLEKKLADARLEVELAAEQKSNWIEEGTKRAQESLKTVKAELDRVRGLAAKQKQALTREITDMTANREQLKKEVATMTASKRNLEGGAQRVENEALRASERINQDKQSLEREVANLQNQKSQLGHEVKRLETRLDEIQRDERATQVALNT